MEPDEAVDRQREAGEDELATRLSALRRVSASLDVALARWQELREHREPRAEQPDIDNDVDSESE